MDEWSKGVLFVHLKWLTNVYSNGMLKRSLEKFKPKMVYRGTKAKSSLRPIFFPILSNWRTLIWAGHVANFHFPTSTFQWQWWWHYIITNSIRSCRMCVCDSIKRVRYSFCIHQMNTHNVYELRRYSCWDFWYSLHIELLINKYTCTIHALYTIILFHLLYIPAYFLLNLKLNVWQIKLSFLTHAAYRYGLWPKTKEKNQ